MQAIAIRFDQKGYKILSSLETMLCDENVDFSKFDDVLKLYQNDFRRDTLQTQLLILHSSMPSDIKNEKSATKLKSILNYLQSLNECEKKFYDEIIKLAKIILVMPATNASSERSFSSLRRLKTWLRSTMNQTRLNWCMILHTHNDVTDNLNLKDLANEFISRNDSRQRIFGQIIIIRLS